MNFRIPLPVERRGLSAGWCVSVAVHLAVLGALAWIHAGAARPSIGPSPIIVSVLELSADEPPGPPLAQDMARETPEATPIAPVTPRQETVPVSAPDMSDVLSDAQLVGAVSADAQGSGGGGGRGGCDTAQILQRALARDSLVHRAVADAGRAGKAVMLWNGDWVRSGDQAGKGLSRVRQAIAWELAFTPEPCRNTVLQGVVLLSLPDGTRFAIGTDTWRWSDLLGLE